MFFGCLRHSFAIVTLSYQIHYLYLKLFQAVYFLLRFLLIFSKQIILQLQALVILWLKLLLNFTWINFHKKIKQGLFLLSIQTFYQITDLFQLVLFCLKTLLILLRILLIYFWIQNLQGAFKQNWYAFFFGHNFLMILLINQTTVYLLSFLQQALNYLVIAASNPFNKLLIISLDIFSHIHLLLAHLFLTLLSMLIITNTF